VLPDDAPDRVLHAWQMLASDAARVNGVSTSDEPRDDPGPRARHTERQPGPSPLMTGTPSLASSAMTGSG